MMRMPVTILVPVYVSSLPCISLGRLIMGECMLLTRESKYINRAIAMGIGYSILVFFVFVW